MAGRHIEAITEFEATGMAVGPSAGKPSDEATDEAVARLRRVVLRMQAAMRESGGRSAAGRRLTLADLADTASCERLEAIRGRAGFAPTDHFGPPLVAKYPHLAWLDRADGGHGPTARQSLVA